MKIKLCGMFRDCDIDYANEAKPDYVGFILGFPKSHRNIDAETARRLRSRLDTGIKAVGVFVNSPETTCAEYANCGIIDVIQLHGDEDADFIRRLRELTGAPIIKAAKIRTPEDVGRDSGARRRITSCLTTARAPARCSIIPCWTAQRYASRFSSPGGLHRRICGQAAESVRPYCVDLSSGVETDRLKTAKKCWKRSE